MAMAQTQCMSQTTRVNRDVPWALSMSAQSEHASHRSVASCCGCSFCSPAFLPHFLPFGCRCSSFSALISVSFDRCGKLIHFLPYLRGK
ncbi:hypothetical protein V9T40_000382 [Parthenolecanium corni]|uniref:Uncharacterized protein n=1 Tax=Parthenolecanium corni TaxID=536013 RepID=A0AAN9TD83_9HEMI